MSKDSPITHMLIPIRPIAVLMLFAFLFSGCRQSDKTPDGRTVVTYWEKWTGFEAKDMKEIVDKFNHSQDRIFVQYISISSVDRKLTVAIAAGLPPDIGGVWDLNIPSMAENGALTDLTDRCEAAGLTREYFLHISWAAMTYCGRVYALVSATATILLHWNKELFKAAGLDPLVPPRTIAQFDDFSDRLTLFKDDASNETVSYHDLALRLGGDDKATAYIKRKGLTLLQVGFLPSEPGWWPWSFGYQFGGTLFKAPDSILADSPENIRAFEWAQSFMRKYGPYNVKRLSSGFGQFSSPQNAFACGKMAMTIQGSWMHDFLSKFAPTMEWGAAPIPVVREELYGLSWGNSDLLVIPKGAKHPQEAFEFIKFLERQDNMEAFCQHAFTPLTQVSPGFFSNHVNPYIRIYRDAAQSPLVFVPPRVPFWSEYLRDMQEGFSRIWLNLEDPAAVLKEVAQNNRERMQLYLELKQRERKP
jgi:multiple sugar transport system substrate-binding protein